jgi:formiminotetrahydrofolate cyclodeaminase
MPPDVTGQPGFTELPVAAFLRAMAAPQPAPAGGCAAALALAQAAALCAKTARLSARQLTAERTDRLTADAEQIREAAASLVDEDARAYRAVIDARREPAEVGRVADALSRAADVPMRILELAAAVAEMASALAADGKPALRGDALTAVLLAHAAARSAAILMRIDLAGAPGDPRLDRAERLLARIAQSADRIG